MRSLLYVPGSRPRMLAKLATLEADAVVLDLEDGVAPADKAAAREAIRATGLREGWPPWSLRVNAVGSAWHDPDFALAHELRAPRILVPKAEDPAAVLDLARRCEEWGAGVGLMIETARGVGRVRELAAAHPAIDLLVFGSADYRLSVGARPDADRAWERHALGEVLLAAKLHDCLAIDSVYFRFRDDDGLGRQATIAREMGFDGKSCIHPDQIGPIHAVFSSTPDELEWAGAVRRAWVDQDGDRAGVVVVDGEMIEALHFRLAERIASRAPDR